MTGIICPTCGEKSPIDAVVCAYCGEEFNQTSGTIETTLYAFPEKSLPFLSMEELKIGNIKFFNNKPSKYIYFTLTGIGEKVLEIVEHQYPQYKITNADNRLRGLTSPDPSCLCRLKIVTSEIEILFAVNVYNKWFLPSPISFFSSLDINGKWKAVAEFVSLLYSSLNFTPWEHAQWGRFVKTTQISKQKVIDGWRNIIDKHIEECQKGVRRSEPFDWP